MNSRPTGATELRTNAQNARLWKLLNQLDIDEEQRRDLVKEYTLGRTDSSRAMLAHECASLIHALEQQLGVDSAKCWRMRRKVYSLAHELGWETSDGAVCKERLQNWINKFGRHHVELNKMNERQLRDTITQLEILADKYDKAHG